MNETTTEPTAPAPPSPHLPPRGEHTYLLLMDRDLLSRRLAFIMLVRVLVFTLILGGTVVANIVWGTPDRLGERYVTFLFIFVAGLYLLNIFYALLMRWMKDLGELAAIQLGCDLVAAAVLINFTGGADSPFMLVLMLSPIGAALMLNRRAAVITAGVGSLMLVLVIFLGYTRLLPTLPGQSRMPWDVSGESIISALLVNGSAMFAVALLTGYLSEQVRTAALTLQAQKATIYDLTTLNEDIVRCLTSGLVTVNRTGRVLAINQYGREILGVDDPKPVGKLLADFCPEMANLAAQPARAQRTELTLGGETDGRLLGVSISPLTDHLNQLQGRIINFQDLTDWKRMERRVAHAEHLASLGRIAAAIAHEIRNPLGSISASLEMLQMGDVGREEDRKLMVIALREIERLNRLISDLLEYARPHPIQTRVQDLREVLPELLQSITSLMSGLKELNIHLIPIEEEIRVKVDPEKLQGVLWNLVLNAYEAGERKDVTIRAVREGDLAVLEVEDHGAGMDPEQAAKVFEPFFTTKDQGTGLGLAMVYQVVQEHEGRIEVMSKKGVGTTFRILLPLQGQPA